MGAGFSVPIFVFDTRSHNGYILLTLFSKPGIMKHFLLVLLFAPLLCSAHKNKYRDICKKITKSYTRVKHKRVVTYHTPNLVHLSGIKQVKDDTVFALHLHIPDSREHFDATGATVEFEDGTILKDELVKVDCRQEQSEIALSANSGNHSGEYILQGFFPIDGTNEHEFLTKKIVRVQLHSTYQEIPDKEAVRMRRYLKCLKDRS
jgi:hypothetical protein